MNLHRGHGRRRRERCRRRKLLFKIFLAVALYLAVAEMYYYWRHPELTYMQLLVDTPEWIWPW